MSWPAVLEDAGPADLSWVIAYSEPDLTRLVEDAQRNHHDIRTLAPRMNRAITLADDAALALQEALSTGSENQGSSSYEIPTLHRRQVTWEADVWQRLQDENYSSLELATADVRAARASLNAAIVSTYFLLLEANRQKTVLRGHLISSRELVNKIELKAASANADAQSQSSLFWDPSAGEEKLIKIDEARRKASQSLEILIYGFPPVLLSTKQNLPVLPPNLPPGLSSKRLEQRPDLLAAELNFLEGHPKLDQSNAPSLPMFDLFGEFGAPSKQLIEYADSIETDGQDEIRFLILQDPIRDIETTDDPGMERMQGIAQYETVALNAFREVRALSESTQRLAEWRAFLEVAEAQSKSALEAALEGGQTGEQDFRRILNELQSLYRFRTALLTVRRQQLNHHATMMLSLGRA